MLPQEGLLLMRFTQEGTRMSAYELAQLNIALMKEPLESPTMADFVANLDRINALAESSPGFVWRLKTDDGNATALRPLGEDSLVNVSVWKDVDSLNTYGYQSAHVVVGADAGGVGRAVVGPKRTSAYSAGGDREARPSTREGTDTGRLYVPPRLPCSRCSAARRAVRVRRRVPGYLSAATSSER